MEPLVSKRGKHIRQRQHPTAKGRRPDHRKQRQVQANDRQRIYDGLTVEQKIAQLDEKLGVGVGAKKQRERLAQQLASKKEVSQ